LWQVRLEFGGTARDLADLERFGVYRIGPAWSGIAATPVGAPVKEKEFPMRLMKVLCLGVAALGLSAGSSVWAGDDEAPCPKCESGEGHGIFHRIRHKHVHSQPMHVCAKCMKKIQNQGPPATVVVEGVQPGLCPTCQMAALESSAPLIIEGHAVANPPGTIIVEDGQPGTVLASSGAGHAVVGEAAPAGEPEPIGVMRTNYTEAAVVAPTPSQTQAASGKAVVDTMERAPKHGWRKPKPDPANGSSAGRDLELEWSHLFLPRFGTIRQARKDAEKAAHAQVRYDDNQQQVTELPAKVVFGR
jgi:hypothetical protein